mgnify:CR=1 FL=1
MKYIKNLLMYLGFLWLLVLNFSFVDHFMTVDNNNVEDVALLSTVALILWGIEFFGIRYFWKNHRNEPAQS